MGVVPIRIRRSGHWTHVLTLRFLRSCHAPGVPFIQHFKVQGLGFRVQNAVLLALVF